MQRCFSGIICVMGIAGNVLSLIVFSFDRSATFLSMKVLASSDMAFLFCAVVNQVIPMYCYQTGDCSAFCRAQGYLQTYTWPAVCIAQMITVWVTVLISLERFIAICMPLRAISLCTLPKIRIAIIAIVLSSVLFNLPKFFEFRTKVATMEGSNLTHVVVDGDTLLRRSTLYMYLYNMALFCIVMYAVPFLLLVGLNVKLIHALHGASKQWEMLNRNQQKEVKATIIPMCIVIVFFICGTQSLISFILDAVYVDKAPDWLRRYTGIANLLIVINSASNFLIFFVFGKKFRSVLRAVCHCQHTDIRRGSSVLKESMRRSRSGNSQEQVRLTSAVHHNGGAP